MTAFAEYILMQASEEYMPFMNIMREKIAMSKVLENFCLFIFFLLSFQFVFCFISNNFNDLTSDFLCFRSSLNLCRIILRQDMRIC